MLNPQSTRKEGEVENKDSAPFLGSSYSRKHSGNNSVYKEEIVSELDLSVNPSEKANSRNNGRHVRKSTFHKSEKRYLVTELEPIHD